jgi:hypothetical protein
MILTIFTSIQGGAKTTVRQISEVLAIMAAVED